MTSCRLCVGLIRAFHDRWIEAIPPPGKPRRIIASSSPCQFGFTEAIWAATVLGRVRALAHITGGGLPGNLNRALPSTLDAEVDTASWEIPNAFRVLEAAGGVARDEMFRAFNMGVGMVVVADPADVSSVMQSAADAGVRAWRLGHVAPGTGQVQLRSAR